ncbi:MAG: undecaprenyl-diphosphate phosphatase [Candidatus Eremiobacteraeota bacterium]|nr:undecaprenyl-diphosphate phosphatase [Candidatus Eremiobacteraeota bacterium]
MDIFQALILGVVEGITEYLPVSSTGHLLLTQRALGIPESEAANAYAIAIQAGAILAVLRLYWPRVKQVLEGFVGKNPEGKTLGICLITAFLPAAVVGLLFDDKVEEYLFGLWPIAIAWLVGGLVILAFPLNDKKEGKGLEVLHWRAALGIGLMQCLALWPGTSRSLVTILAGLFLGLSVAAAVELSFLLGLVTLGAATAYEGLRNGSVMVDAYGIGVPLVGLVAALVSAFIAVRWMVSWLQSRGLAVFGWYRIAAGIVLVVLLASGTV